VPKVVVTRGSIFVPDLSALAEQRRINLLAPGHGSRMSLVGDVAVLGRGDAARLSQLGIVELITEE
jgi:hypothetical protein